VQSANASDVTSPRGRHDTTDDDDENEHRVRESDDRDERDERGSRQERDATRVARDRDARESGKDGKGTRRVVTSRVARFRVLATRSDDSARGPPTRLRDGETRR